MKVFLRILKWGAPTLLVLLVPLSLPFFYRPTRVRLLARMGNVGAMYELGRAYSISGGDRLLVRPDEELAYYWLERAAERGNVDAMWRMVNFAYDPHRGYKFVQTWLPRAAESGHLPSMIELSKAYQYGMYGFPQDPKLAKEWADKVKKVPHHW